MASQPVILDAYVCTKCGQGKSWDSFPKCSRFKHGIRKTCWDCCRGNHLRVTTKYRGTDQGKLSSRAGKLKERYGISLDQYEEMLELQNGACAICFQLPGDKVLGVDHDHRTGKVRGLLCGPCNRGIGHLRDDPTLLQSAISYLGGQ